MHKIPLTRTPGGFSQNSFPDAVKRLKLSGYEAQKFADMALHLEDLTFAAVCLDRLMREPMEPLLLDALWMSALVSFFKCFGDGVRSKLLSSEVYKDKNEEEEQYRYFKAVRDKRIAHDGNAFTRASAFAYLNRETVKPKIAAVTSTIMTTSTDPRDFAPMATLTHLAMWWCKKTFEGIREKLIQDLENLEYAELEKYDEVNELPNTGEYKNAFKGRPSTNSMKNKKEQPK